MKTNEQKLKEEIEKLYQFCKHNQEAVDRLNRIDGLIQETYTQAKKEVIEIVILYFDSCMLLKKVPKKEEILKKLEELGEMNKTFKKTWEI